MRTYIRSREGKVFFFTLVTHQRRQILTTPLGRASLRHAIKTVREKHPFWITGIVLLPDHLHTIWEMPRNDLRYPMRWRLIKRKFTNDWLDAGGSEGKVSESRKRKGERGIWQRRYYEHTCRDEDDLKRFLDYIHVNPLKHGFVQSVKDWKWSSFHRYVRLGEYPENWGSAANWYGDEFEDVE